YPEQTFQDQRNFRSSFKEQSNRLLILVNNHQLKVKKAPEIGWFKILYPELNEFLLPFPLVQGLNSSWQWYEKGIEIPVLKQKIHPFYGTYFPTRFDHLKLFDNWLKQYQGDKKSAIDVGVGCGVLSFQLLNHGFEEVYGTDSNPNVIIGLEEELSKNKLNSKIELFYGDLFTGITEKTALIVFNPPWIPAAHNLEGIDKAIYYDTELFPRFFKEAAKFLKEDGKIVLLFSNLAQITKVNEVHPIKEELVKGGRFQKELFLQKEVTAASHKTKRNQNWRTTEMVELWVLKSKKQTTFLKTPNTVQ
ncbi:MAG: methyltransferase, partial [Flavobacteriaceae bacterium]|nr:methyltransferase [Flavobacteriaceae bacterium]